MVMKSTYETNKDDWRYDIDGDVFDFGIDLYETNVNRGDHVEVVEGNFDGSDGTVFKGRVVEITEDYSRLTVEYADILTRRIKRIKKTG
ncbi:hypothetical protein HXA34_20710 [Salipaludibacillus agaradhaerens]|jgi:hypothetical protein|uniref:hypothetical protein n=1 Tax=Salipaludibacillus agaradhaerens TaxID=76935 RepID=UPI00215146F4|nr:hypothetical protein [Salipaludibacillus agaradhaerens]MCR6108722.1 hypothetical protein [Salipaludibacillus agaradhaerens]MCR6120745.1 hypothetical protein [Salipaludibacillus agaradhaerens]